MNHRALQGAVVAVIFLFLGVATAAAVLAFIPNPGSPPSVFDDFNFASTSNGFWHVDTTGGTVTIKDSVVTMSGAMTELDHRLQTDPHRTIVVVKIRGLKFGKFAIGLGQYKADTVGLEFDNDGAKCTWPTQGGESVQILKGWKRPPAGQWFYLVLSVTNPYPRVQTLTSSMTKPIEIACTAYDASGRPLNPALPAPMASNVHYAGFDQVYIRTWDSGNRYQIDWLYAGPASGNPVSRLMR